MRILRYIVLGLIALCLVTVALANRDVVMLRLLPPDLAALVGLNPAVEVPLYAVIFAGVVIGVLVGFVWEWLREHKHRAAASRYARHAAGLERELARSGAKPAGKGPADEITALLDAPKTRSA